MKGKNMRSQHWRDLDFYDQNRTDRVLVIGAGHIGSYVAYYLAKLGVKDITVVDFDYVEPHNLPHQFLAESLVNGVAEDAQILKVDILKQSIDFMVRDANIKYMPSKIEDVYREILQSPPIAVFVCADGMELTKWIYNTFNVCNCLFVDARTGGEYVNIYSIAPQDYKYYETSFYSDEEAIPLPCTGMAIIDVAAASSAEAVNRFRLWTNNRLEILHTFHDYSTGIHSVMQFKKSYNSTEDDTLDEFSEDESDSPNDSFEDENYGGHNGK
jgi:molybdopterin/thiamine biosynthesis adenylyltransferase